MAEKYKIRKYAIDLGTRTYSLKFNPNLLKNNIPSKVKSTRWTTNLKDWLISPTRVNNEIRISAIINLSP
jgi:hypothetical protein